MKTTPITLSAAFLFLMILIAGCSKDNSNKNQTPAGEAPYVAAIIISNGNPTYATSIGVAINDMQHSGIGIPGATVTANGMDVEDKGSGSYTLLLTSNPITAGMNITLNISCAAGNFTVSGVMPESGNQSQVDIPGCYTGSKMSMGNNI